MGLIDRVGVTWNLFLAPSTVKASVLAGFSFGGHYELSDINGISGHHITGVMWGGNQRGSVEG